MTGKVKLFSILEDSKSPGISQKPGVMEAEAHSRKFPNTEFKTNKTNLSIES